MLQVGEPAPSFTLPDASMEMMNLSSYRGKKNVVLYFYPKDGTPACTIQAIGFSDREDEFKKLDTIVFGVSRDDVLSHQAPPPLAKCVPFDHEALTPKVIVAPLVSIKPSSVAPFVR